MRAWGIERLAALALFVGALGAGCTNTPAAACEPACGSSTTCCDSATGPHCQSTLVDPHNCGGCGIDCAGGTCSLGHCMPAGPDSGLHLDGGRDAAVIGDCHPSCASGLMCCGSTCVSSTGVVSSATSTTDPSFMNCHICGNHCDAMTASHCGLPHGTTSGTPQCLCGDLPTCVSGFQCQLNAGSYSCINMMTDPRHCGDPPVSCMTGEACMAGTCTCMAACARCPTDRKLCTSTGCVDTMTDVNNCGTVGNVCHAGENCSGGVCSCGTSPRCMGGGLMGCGQTCCGGTCVYVDDYNCGGCGTACTGGMVCGHNPFGVMAHCGDGAGVFITCDAPDDAAPGPDAGPVDAGMADDAGLDASTDDASTDDAGNDAFM